VGDVSHTILHRVRSLDLLFGKVHVVVISRALDEPIRLSIIYPDIVKECLCSFYADDRNVWSLCSATINPSSKNIAAEFWHDEVPWRKVRAIDIMFVH
jgi:hypothetical protein